MLTPNRLDLYTYIDVLYNIDAYGAIACND